MSESPHVLSLSSPETISEQPELLPMSRGLEEL
jgi:hypothetical protein